MSSDTSSNRFPASADQSAHYTLSSSAVQQRLPPEVKSIRVVSLQGSNPDKKGRNGPGPAAVLSLPPSAPRVGTPFLGISLP